MSERYGQVTRIFPNNVRWPVMKIRARMLGLSKEKNNLVNSSDTSSPDLHGIGFVDAPLGPLRYDGHTDDPYEVAGVLRELMPQRARVLDVGCGTGSVTIIANRDKANRVVAIEPDKSRAELAASRGIDVSCGFLTEEYVAANGPFDVVMLSDVLEHVPSPDDILKLAVSGLRPGGVLLFSVPNVAHWSMRLNLLIGRFNYTETGLCDATHLRWFTKRTTQALILKQALEIVAFRYTAGVTLPVYFSACFRIIPRQFLQTLVRNLTRIFPKLFACQFVVKAVKPLD
jgi:2-polyprenyl-3-methyl-5-hydroxy-6-metoxy-1,4-benzoquinol methylase